MEDKSDFIPTACSTVSRKKLPKKFTENSTFAEGNSLFFGNNSEQKDRSELEASYQLEEQIILSRTSLQRANRVRALPSKYLLSNFTKSETATNICNESTVSESDLLQTPRNTSTPRNSIHSHSTLDESLAQLSHKVNDSNLTIDSLVDDFKKVMRNADGERSSIFKPGEEAASMLLADEVSWRRKNEVPVQHDQFSQIHTLGRESVGDFFQQRCDTLSHFPGGDSPNVTRDPVPLIDLSMSTVNNAQEIPEGNKQKKSISISMIQRVLTDSNCTFNKAINVLQLNENMGLSENKLNHSLSVSNYSSFTSAHSENIAMKEMCNKENINSLNSKTTSIHLLSPSSSRASSRASSALSSLQYGKLPIETTKCELIWGCVKVGKAVTQEFLIRNKSSKRLGVQLSLCTQEFKFRKENRNDSEPLSSNKILLHPNESKAIIVSFIPTKGGAAVDELLFTPLDQNLKQTRKQCVRLFGYGGSYKVEFSNLARDTTGKFWLSLGKLDDRTVITSTFKVHNKGDLPIFIHISIQSVDTHKLDVIPNFFVLMPQIQKEIVINYRPSNEDYNFLHRPSVVVELGNLNVTVGTEVDRGRLRKICEACVDSVFNREPLVSVLKEKINGEVMPVDLVKFKESPPHLKEILKLFSHHQVVLTLERDPEQTIIQQFSDDLDLYQSLYQDTTVLSNKTSVLNSCYVAPAIIVLTLPYKYKDSVFLKSENGKKLNFKVSCPSELEVKPKDGILEAHGTAIVSIKYSSATASEKKNFKVLVIVENEIFEIDIKVESLGHTKNKNKSLLHCI